MLDARVCLLCIFILSSSLTLNAIRTPGRSLNSVKSAVFLSPPFFSSPGSVSNKYYFDIPFPGGHIAIKSLDAEVVDEAGTPVPLHETYLHHWLIEGYYGRKSTKDPIEANPSEFKFFGYEFVENSGVCNRTLRQYFGLGSETRRTKTWVPDPYGIEVGNPEQIPDDFEHRWLMNVHAIDTRGVVDKLGCTECRCSLYNVTKNEYGRPLRKDYIGGLWCCYDHTQCLVQEGFGGTRRKLYLRYKVTWQDWDNTIVPVKIYIFDVTNTAAEKDGAVSACKVEYQVEPCDLSDRPNNRCIDIKKAKMIIPRGGDIVYGVAHQHSAGIGSTLYGQDGRVLCNSMPTYGDGKEAGNEKGYIVGMSTCYPTPGSVKVLDGEVLTLVSNYSNTEMHTGVMGLFYILVAEKQEQVEKMSLDFHSFPLSVRDEAA
ncbi:putative stress up-regulated Nod 19 [Dioscorea sansibarensis]